MYEEVKNTMEKLTVIVSVIGIIGTISSIFFAYLAFKKNDRQEARNEGKTQGSIFSDIGYIKACVDRVEKNLNTVDERYLNIAQRLARVEESVFNVTKRVDGIHILDGT